MGIQKQPLNFEKSICCVQVICYGGRMVSDSRQKQGTTHVQWNSIPLYSGLYALPHFPRKQRVLSLLFSHTNEVENTEEEKRYTTTQGRQTAFKEIHPMVVLSEWGQGGRNCKWCFSQTEGPSSIVREAE